MHRAVFFFALAGCAAPGETAFVDQPNGPPPSRTSGGAEGGTKTADATAPVEAAADVSSLDAALPARFVPPTIDGTVMPGEYGEHADGKNMMRADIDASLPTTWFMTWDDQSLYIAVTSADVQEGVVVYVDKNPAASLADVDGSQTGKLYDGTNISLPFRADFVAYIKATYQERRTADGAGGWSTEATQGITVAGTGNAREIAIPWSRITGGGRPPEFSWLGYVTSASGYVYGEMPMGNPGAFVGTSAAFRRYFEVPSTRADAKSFPFALERAR